MTVEKPLTRDEVSKQLEEIRQSTQEKLAAISKTHAKVYELISATKCEAVLERLLGDKVTFMFDGSFAGKFLAAGFDDALKSSKAKERELAAYERLNAFGMRPEVGFRYAEGKYLHC